MEDMVCQCCRPAATQDIPLTIFPVIFYWEGHATSKENPEMQFLEEQFLSCCRSGEHPWTCPSHSTTLSGRTHMALFLPVVKDIHWKWMYLTDTLVGAQREDLLELHVLLDNKSQKDLVLSSRDPTGPIRWETWGWKLLFPSTGQPFTNLPSALGICEQEEARELWQPRFSTLYQARQEQFLQRLLQVNSCLPDLATSWGKQIKSKKKMTWVAVIFPPESK